MYRFYLAAVDLLPAALLMIPVFWIMNQLYFHNWKKSVLYCLISCYLSVVYVMVGLPTVTYIRPELNLNLIPIIPMVDDLKNSVLNVFLFIPIGVMLPLGWGKLRELRYVIRFGFGISLCIELLQMLTFRATDVNDLITNTLGTYLGYLAARAMVKQNSRIANLVVEKNNHSLFVILLIVFGIMFFLYPFVSATLWDWILA